MEQGSDVILRNWKSYQYQTIYVSLHKKYLTTFAADSRNAVKNRLEKNSEEKRLCYSLQQGLFSCYQLTREIRKEHHKTILVHI